MRLSPRIIPAALFLIFLAAVAYWADTDTMPAMLQAVYRFPNGDRVGHFVLYGLLAGLLQWALGDRHPWLGLLVAGGIATLEEVSQLFFFHRSADWVDWGWGLAGIATAQLLIRAWHWPTTVTRSRLVYGALGLMVIAVGLASRAKSVQPFLGPAAGDVLWALLVFLGIGWWLPRLATGRVAVWALLFAWAVEFSQLYHAPWLDAVRQTRPGALALGQGFLWTDLVCYAVGVAGGVVLERLVIPLLARRWTTP